MSPETLPPRMVASTVDLLARLGHEQAEQVKARLTELMVTVGRSERST